MSSVWEQKMKTVFNCLDRKQVQKVGHEDLVTFALRFQKHGHIDKEGEEQLRDNIVGFWKELNESGGEVDVNGFIDIHRRLVTEKEFGDQSWGKYMKNIALFAFQSVSNAEKGTVSISEYKEFLRCLGVKNIDEAENIFPHLDQDKKGELNLDDFLTVWREFELGLDDTPSKLLFGPLQQ